MFASWSHEALQAYLEGEGYDIPPGTTAEELRLYVAELHGLQETKQDDDDGISHAAEIVPPVVVEGEAVLDEEEEKPAERKSVRWATTNLHEEFAYEARYDEEVGEAEIDNFAKPTKHAARQYASLHHPRRIDGQRYSPLCSKLGRYCFRNPGPISTGFDWMGEGTVSELTKFGSGLTLHFKNLKLLFWLYFFATVLALPQLILNYQNEQHGGGLLGTTIGNLFTTGNDSLVFLCGSSEGYLCDYSIQGLSSLYTTTEAIIVLLFTCALLWIQYFIPKEQKIAQSLFLSIDLYSVWVPEVPVGCGEETLKQFFEGFTGEEVEEVNIAYDDGELINLFIERGQVLGELWRVTGRVLLEFALKPKPTRLLNEEEMILRKADSVERLVEFYDLLLTTYHSLNEQTRSFNKGGSRAISAVITFQTRIGMIKALGLTARDKFQNMAIKCIPAPPPSTIQWENLEYPLASQVRRQFLSALVVMGAIFGSFVAATGSNAYRNELAVSDLDPCGLYSPTSAAAAMLDPTDVCYEYWQDKAPLFIFTVLAILVVALVNYLVGLVAVSLSPLEKHHSLNSSSISIAIRLFVAYSLNTCFVFILVSVFLHGEGEDLTLSWYANVGSQILLMMLFNVITPHLPILISYLHIKWLQWFGDKPLLQRELNERSIGPNFPFAVRSAQIMMQGFVTLVFGPGMPLLYPIATISFWIFYWVDKTCVLRFYRTPPEFGSEMSSVLVIVLWLGVMGNLLFAIWAYSIPGLFTATITPVSFSQRINQPHILPLVLVCIPVLTLFVLTSLVGLTLSCRRCCMKKRIKKSTRDLTNDYNDLPPLRAAMQSGWLRGLKSYNILQNPKYRRAFGVSKSFCDEHSHVNSVVALPEGDGLPELPPTVRKWLSEF
ncbi:hypothetical protein BASA81_006562 [Batrachochytrium salamandrivorans]|nr:hypothetical protein BASA81_006562 [Batrachochytrium salamandrivorans]